jgi:hypothetical protein
MERQPVVRLAANSLAEYISCSTCCWGEAVVAATTLNTDAEIQRHFNRHHCEDFPRCQVKGCRNRAAYGFRESKDVTSSQSAASEFIVVEVMNWCVAHDSEIRPQYEDRSGYFVGPL